jgi:spermidine synthase
VLALTGAATFLLEIAWTRVFASVIGPSTYAFAATLAGVIGGLAVGSMVGVPLAGRTTRPALALALALGGTAIAATWGSSFAGRTFPLWVLEEFARSGAPFGELLIRHSLMIASLVAAPALGLGVAYPLALSIAAPGREAIARRLGTAYALNTVASVVGSLGAGFLAIPFLGLHGTLRLASTWCLAAGVIAAVAGRLPRFSQIAALLPAAAAAGLVFTAPPWDRELLASGGYKYASRVPKDVDLPSALKAGRLLHYREGPSGIVSVRQLTGERSLAIDGKVDASTAGDMLTQKTLAHLPLLLHEDPDTVCIIGLGSGVTLAAALVHPVSAVDVVEISPEVVDASRHFAAENRDALKNPRTRLILGDGRSHLAWSSRQYDVIISEPSNPWMAGVAALFTREFFAAVRDRLAPHGIICQWAHTYDISEADLRSIVETFRSVFPNGTVWLVGDGDLLLVGAVEPLESRLSNVQTGWQRAGVAEDLGDVSLAEPFGLWSLFAGGPEELKSYGAGAAHQTDDRMALEFSGPNSINSPASFTNTQALRHLLDGRERPAVIARSIATAGAAQWRNRAEMMLGAGAYDVSYENFVTALARDPTDAVAHTGIVRAAVAAHREAEAIAIMKNASAAQSRVTAPRISLSKLLAATGSFDDAWAVARDATLIEPADPLAFDQLASVFADAADANQLESAVEQMRHLFPRARDHHVLRGGGAISSCALAGRVDADPSVDRDRSAPGCQPQSARRHPRQPLAD